MTRAFAPICAASHLLTSHDPHLRVPVPGAKAGSMTSRSSTDRRVDSSAIEDCGALVRSDDLRVRSG